MPMKNIVFVVFNLVFLSACGPAMTTLRHTADYDTTLSRGEVTVLPAYSQVTQGGKGRQYDYEHVLEPILQQAAADILREKGYRVEILHKKDMRDDNLYKDVDRVHERYKEKYKSELYDGPQLFKTEVTSFDIDVSLGNAGEKLFEKTGKKLFVFTDYEEYIQSTAERVAGFAIAVLTRDDFLSGGVENGHVGVGIIDAERGKVIWAHFAHDQETIISAAANNSKSIEDVARMKAHRILKYALAQLPNKSDLHADMQQKRDRLEAAAKRKAQFQSKNTN